MMKTNILIIVISILHFSCSNKVENKTERINNVYYFENTTELKNVFISSFCYVEKIGDEIGFNGTIILQNANDSIDKRESLYNDGLLVKDVYFNKTVNSVFDVAIMEYEYDDEFLINPIYTTTLTELDVDQIRNTIITLYKDGEIVD